MDKLIKLNRFTNLPILIDLLERQKLVLLDPASWDDKNDTDIILEYKRKAKIDKLFALCFTHENETIHHWKTFSNGPSGCCIEFSADKLIEIFKTVKGLRHGKVSYKKINDAGSMPFDLQSIPFIKRKPYEFEREYRAIWEGKGEVNYLEIDIPISIVRRITFSQQMPEIVFESVKAMLAKNYKSLAGKINRSTIYRNDRWINYFRK
jgi:hypothetical protein